MTQSSQKEETSGMPQKVTQSSQKEETSDTSLKGTSDTSQTEGNNDMSTTNTTDKERILKNAEITFNDKEKNKDYKIYVPLKEINEAVNEMGGEK